MNPQYTAGKSLIFYSGQNFAGTSLPVTHGQTGIIAAGSDDWNYKSVAMLGYYAFAWSEVNPGDPTINYQNHTESLITAANRDLTALYPSIQFPLQYLGINTSLAVAVWLDLSSVTGEPNALATTALVGGATNSITTLTLPGRNGVAAFISPVSGSSVMVTGSYGEYNNATGQVNWTGLNEGTLVLGYTGGALSVLSATGFPESWTFSAPVMQADGSWVLKVSEGAVSSTIISALNASKSTLINNGTDVVTLTATVTDSGTGAAVSGVTVNWNSTLGELSTPSSVTDNSGKASTNLKDTGDIGTAIVTASLDNGSSQTVQVSVTQSRDDLHIAGMASDRDTITNDGRETATLTATVKDDNGNLVEGAAVGWSASAGTLSTASSVTNSAGIASVGLTDKGDTVASIIVTATLSNGLSHQYDIQLKQKYMKQSR